MQNKNGSFELLFDANSCAKKNNKIAKLNIQFHASHLYTHTHTYTENAVKCVSLAKPFGIYANNERYQILSLLRLFSAYLVCPSKREDVGNIIFCKVHIKNEIKYIS